jgi:HK97 family phage portal protein
MGLSQVKPGQLLYKRKALEEERPAPEFLRAYAEREKWNVPDYGLADNQAKLYQVLSWVHSAVSAVSGVSATADFKVKKRDDLGARDQVNHPFELLLAHPNPTQSRFDLMFSTFGYQYLTGNAYWWLNCVTSNPIDEIWVLPTNRIKPIPGRKFGLVDHYEFDAGLGKPEKIPPDEIVHFRRWHPRNDFVGLSPVETVGRSAEKEVKAELYDLNFYDKDNAKPPGFIGVDGNVPDNIFEKMQKDLERDHGGTRRKLMLVRSAEGVSWQQMGLSQADMEFLHGREFTKEQIYDLFAPGWAAILAIQSTEASAKVAKATLMEFGVWQYMVSVAERITNTILPLYGEDLVGEFDDVRLVDRAMAMQEQQAYSEVHTIDEVRAKFYNDKPIGDERGELLPGQVGQVQANPEEEEERDEESMTPNMPPRLEKRASPTEKPKEERAQEQVVTGKAVEVVPTEAQLVRDELGTWERFALKRIKGKAKDNREFECVHIEPSLQGSIEGQLEAAQTAEDVTEIFTDAKRWPGYP